MAETNDTMTIEEIATASGVPVRTIRFYITSRLLPGPGARGRAATYSEEHLLRLRLIRLLVEQHVPLEKIRQRLEGLDMADLQAVLAEETDRARAERHSDQSGSPRDYITGLLRRARQERVADPMAPYVPPPPVRRDLSAPATPPPLPAPPPGAPGPRSAPAPAPGDVHSHPMLPPSAANAHLAPAPTVEAVAAPTAGTAAVSPPPDPGQTSGQGWRRWELAPGVELHARDDAGHAYAGLVGRVLELAHAPEEGIQRDERDDHGN